jgi:hypothetical protein
LLETLEGLAADAAGGAALGWTAGTAVPTWAEVFCKFPLTAATFALAFCSLLGNTTSARTAATV